MRLIRIDEGRAPNIVEAEHDREILDEVVVDVQSRRSMVHRVIRLFDGSRIVDELGEPRLWCRRVFMAHEDWQQQEEGFSRMQLRCFNA